MSQFNRREFDEVNGNARERREFIEEERRRKAAQNSTTDESSLQRDKEGERKVLQIMSSVQ